MKLFRLYKHFLFILPAELSHNLAKYILKYNLILKPKRFEDQAH